MKIESIKALKQIKIRDNGESLVDIKKVCPQIIIGDEQLGLKSTKKPGKKKTLYARKTVAKMLKKAQELLPNGYSEWNSIYGTSVPYSERYTARYIERPAHYKLKINDAWRSLKEQEHYYKVKYREVKKKHPTWPKSQLRKEANKYVFPSDVGISPYHFTGGAIDLTICYPNGKSLPMETKKDKIPERILKNRQLLKEVMEKVGFTNYPFEWWHFSYGDSGWALRTKRKTAIYGGVNQK